MTLFGRRAQRPFNRPSSMESADYPLGIEAGHFGPFGRAHSASVPSEQSVIRAVALLLLLCRPSAIVRRVTEIVVLPVYRATSRTWAHISAEVVVSAPAVTDRDAAATVLIEPFTFWVRASRDDAGPYNVLRRPLLTLCLAVRNGSRSALASAAVVIRRLKAIIGHLNYRAADAPATPDNRGSIASLCWRESGKATKHESCQVTCRCAVSASHNYSLLDLRSPDSLAVTLAPQQRHLMRMRPVTSFTSSISTSTSFSSLVQKACCFALKRPVNSYFTAGGDLVGACNRLARSRRTRSRVRLRLLATLSVIALHCNAYGTRGPEVVM